MKRGVKLPQSLFSSGRKTRTRSVQMLSFPSLPLSDRRADRPKHNVSDAEIGQLVSAARNDAIAPLGDRDPETFLIYAPAKPGRQSEKCFPH